MSNFFKWVLFGLNCLRCFPHLLMFYFHKNKGIIHADTRRWLEVLRLPYGLKVGFIYLLSFNREFRNLFYLRVHGIGAHILNIFCPQMSTLLIDCKNVGEGLVIRHGFSTAIGADSIGKNCTIHHQVTLANYKGFPTILDNVTIYPGAVIVGKVKIGNNSIIGANSSVFQDIPDDSSVFPMPSKIVKWNGNLISSMKSGNSKLNYEGTDTGQKG